MLYCRHKIYKGKDNYVLILGFISIVATFIKLYIYKMRKDYRLAMAMGLTFTALTIISECSLISRLVKTDDWSALLDVVPSMENTIWVLTIISIVLNISPILLELKRKKQAF